MQGHFGRQLRERSDFAKSLGWRIEFNRSTRFMLSDFGSQRFKCAASFKEFNGTFF
jgi:hypothetical protein